MTLAPFEPCRRRIRRAKAHRDAFAEEWERFIGDPEDAPYSPSVGVDADGEGAIWINLVKPLPDVLALEFGEMLYQLRAALDGCVYAAVMVETGQDPPPDEDRLEFPITETPDAFKNARWKMGQLSDPRRGLIEYVQPYRALEVPPGVRYVNDSLRLLNDWARKDRHRTLHLVGSWVPEADPQIRIFGDARLVNLTVVSSGLFFKNDCHIADFSIEGWDARTMQVEANPQCVIDVTINEGPPPRDETDDLSTRCTDMLAAVDGVVSTFDESFGPNAPSDFSKPNLGLIG